jgi:uncharacterized protein (DUF2461 family)
LFEVKTALLGLIGTSGFPRINPSHIGVWLSSGTKGQVVGYYVHIEKGACFIAGGFYAPLADDLKVRKEIAFSMMN